MKKFNINILIIFFSIILFSSFVSALDKTLLFYEDFESGQGAWTESVGTSWSIVSETLASRTSNRFRCTNTADFTENQINISSELWEYNFLWYVEGVSSGYGLQQGSVRFPYIDSDNFFNILTYGTSGTPPNWLVYIKNSASNENLTNTISYTGYPKEYNITIIHNETNLYKIYVDGILKTSFYNNKSWNINNYFGIQCSCSGGGACGSNEYNRIDEIYIYEFSETINNFTIISKSIWDNSSINNFSALINGTIYNTTTGTITTDILQNSTSLYNITVFSSDWFNETYLNYNVSSNLEASLKQSEINLSVYKEFEGSIISNYIIVIDNNTFNVTGNWTLIYPNKANYTVTNITDNSGVEDYSVFNGSFEVNALDNKSVNLTVVGHVINIFAIDLITNTSINNFTAYLSGVNFTEEENKSTTNGTVSFFTNDGTFNITIDADGYALDNNSILLTINNSAREWNYTFYLYTQRSVNFSFYDEKNPLVLFPYNITFNLLNCGASSYNTSVGWKYLDDLTPNDYEIQYNSDGFDSRSYFFTVTNRSTENINLYFSNSTLTENYIIRVASLSDVNIPDAKVKLQKQFITLDGQYITIEECKTDSDGECDMFIEESSSINYKFIVIINEKIVKVTDPLNIVNIPSESKSIVLRVDTGESIYQSFQDATNLFYNLKLVNNITTWNVIDSGNSITSFCLKISRKLYNQTSYTLINNQCLSLTSGILTKNISTYLINNSILFIEGQVVYNDDSKLTLDSIYKYTSYGFFGNNIDKNDKLFFTIMIFMFVSLLTVLIPSMIIQIIINLGLLTIAELINFSGLGKIIIINFLILGLIINYSRRNVSVTGV